MRCLADLSNISMKNEHVDDHDVQYISTCTDVGPPSTDIWPETESKPSPQLIMREIKRVMREN